MCYVLYALLEILCISNTYMLYPKINNNYFSLTCEFLKKLENDPKYCLHSSICQSSFSKQCNFDRADIDILTNNNLVTVSSVLRYNFERKKFVTLYDASLLPYTRFECLYVPKANRQGSTVHGSIESTHAYIVL